MGVTDTSSASGPSELPGAAQAPADPVDAPWHRFPRGAFAGDFLHDQLEWLAGERFLLDSSADLQQRLMRRCKRLGWEARADDVVAWLRQVCSRPLPALGAPLAGLATVAPEMEFWYPIESLSLPALDACCRRHILPGQPRPALSPRTVQGMMMGYADLVFEHGGRYWVLDHKSNSLGRADADYDLETLNAAILAHRYDVQAALYLLALHRLLRARLHDGYKPAQHLGGAIYLFLRGVAAAQAGCCTLPATHELLADLDRLLPASPPSAAGPREDGA